MDDNTIRQAAQGDPKAFGDLCQANRNALLHTAEQIVRDPVTAEDLLQEALLESYLNVGKLNSPDKILAWIRGVIRNRCYNHLRRSRTTPLSLGRIEQEVDPADGPLDQLESDERRTNLRNALGTLSETNRRTTELFYLHEKSVKQISHILGITAGATRVRLNRSRTLLRRLLADEHRSESREESSMATPSQVTDKGQRCSFCGTAVEDLELLITGPGVNICSSCVQACVHVMVDKHGYSIQLAPSLDESVANRITAAP